jgi:hypothetical protein
MLPAMTYRRIKLDDLPSWVLQPLPQHVQDAIGILEAAMEKVKGRGYYILNSAICYLENQGPPDDTEWLRQMGIEP